MGLTTFSYLKTMKAENAIVLEGNILKRYQSEVLKIAEDVIEVCEKENIYYTLCGGAALGAVRKGKFIPWDDDIDIFMLDDEYSRFKDCFMKEYSDKYWWHDEETPWYEFTISRILLKGSIIRAYGDANTPECGFYVEIFRLVNTFDNPVLRIVQGVFCLGFGFLSSCRRFYSNKEMMLHIAKDNPKAKKVFYFKIALGRMCSFWSASKWAQITQKCHSLCKNSHSKYISSPSGRKHYFGEMYLRENMVNTVKMPFEGHQWCVPQDYDGFFKTIYGPDYMTPPSEEEREKHVVLEIKFPDEVDRRE